MILKRVTLCLMAFLLLLNGPLCAQSSSKKGKSSSQKLVAFEGKVKSVSVVTSKSQAPMKGLTDTKLDFTKTFGATVNIGLMEYPGKEFDADPVMILNLPGFGDLKSKFDQFGPLMILNDLQKRLIGKDIAVKCVQVEKEKSFFIKKVEII